MSKKQKKLLIRITVSLLLFVGVLIVQKLTDINKYILILLYLVPYLIAGYDVLLGCVKNILRGKVFDEEFLMSVATVGALIIGEYPESVFVMVFFQAGELFQNIAVGKSRNSIKALMELVPDEATVIRDGKEETVFPEEVEKGETILVRAGEKIPLDSIVLEGEAAVDMKALTGESVPSDIYAGCEVKAGSICLTGTLKLEAVKEYTDSTVAKILELVENSSLHKAKTEKFLTKFSRVYTPAVVISALLLGVIPSLITGNWSEWVYRALIFLVVSCPCALVISVPLSYFSAIGRASSKGILIKGANYLEALGNANTFAFDKTGTLTTGEFSVIGLYPEKGVTEKELLSNAATAEYYSLHPLGKGILAKENNAVPPDSVREFPGLGIEALADGKTVLAGNLRFMEKNGIIISSPKKETGVYVARDKKYLGFIALADEPKENVKNAFSKLKALGVERLVMLTGDSFSAAEYTAERVGISEWKSGLLPEDKAVFVEKLCKDKKKGQSVIFTGDGINDAPVLSLSDVGIAMGGIGSDAAIEAADVVIMDDNIEKCAEAVRIAKKTKRIVRENVVFALGVKFAVLILASFGLAGMWLGVFADVGVAVLAIINAVKS